MLKQLICIFTSICMTAQIGGQQQMLIAAKISAAATTVTYVQKGKASSGFFGPAISVALTSVVSGHCIVGFVGWEDTSARTLTSVTGSLGTTYTLYDNPTNIGTIRVATFLGKLASSGTETISTAFSVDPRYSFIAVTETSDCNATPVDGHVCATQTNPGTGGDAVTSGNITTGANGTYVFGGSFVGAITGTWTIGTGFAQLQQEPAAPNSSMASEGQTQTSAGAIAATLTYDQAIALTATCAIGVKY